MVALVAVDVVSRGAADAAAGDAAAGDQAGEAQKTASTPAIAPPAPVTDRAGATPTSEDEAAAWQAQLLLVSEGFVVRTTGTVLEPEARALGRDVIDLVRGQRSELSFQTKAGDLYLSLVRRSRGEIGVAGHLKRDASGLLSAFESRTDQQTLEQFGDALRVFPYGG